MAATVQGAQIFQLILIRGGLGFYAAEGDITLAAGTITSTTWLANANWGSNEFLSKQLISFRPDAASAADYIRYAGTVVPSTGVLSLDRNVSDTTKTGETFYFIYNGVHPQWIVDAINRAMDKTYFENTEPLSTKPAGSILADAGFQSTATTSYTESDADGGAATTFTKVTTANSENVYQGIGSGSLLNAAAGGYIRQRFNTTPGERVIVHALSRLDSGTNAELVLRDTSNSAFIGTTVEHSQEAWQWMKRDESIPSGCKIMEVRWQGEGTTDQVYWGGHSILFPEQSRVILDTKWEQPAWRIPALVCAMPRGTSVASNVYSAFATELVEIPRTDYSFMSARGDAHPYAVQFHNGSQQHWFQYPIFIQGRRALSDLTSFTLALTETTPGDIDLIEATARVELFRDQRVAMKVANADLRLADAFGDVQSMKSMFITDGPAQRKQPYVFPRLAS